MNELLVNCAELLLTLAYTEPRAEKQKQLIEGAIQLIKQIK